MTKHEITCETCGCDLTTTGNCEDYRLSLKVERIPPRGPTVTLMSISPAMSRDADFCCLTCLHVWMNKAGYRDL